MVALVLPRMGQLPKTKAAIYTPTTTSAVRIVLVNTTTSNVKVNLYTRLAAYTATSSGERRIIPKDMVLKAKGSTEKSGIVLGKKDELLADASVGVSVDFTISGVIA